MKWSVGNKPLWKESQYWKPPSQTKQNENEKDRRLVEGQHVCKNNNIEIYIIFHVFSQNVKELTSELDIIYNITESETATINKTHNIRHLAYKAFLSLFKLFAHKKNSKLSAWKSPAHNPIAMLWNLKQIAKNDWNEAGAEMLKRWHSWFGEKQAGFVFISVLNNWFRRIAKSSLLFRRFEVRFWNENVIFNIIHCTSCLSHKTIS